jgi:dTDP-4-dehydrorhamnose reductase
VIEVWASPEPSIARIDAATVRDQGRETGFRTRFADIDAIAGLGVAATRFPLLWEHDDLAWAAPRLERLREGGVEPIVTLVHHGSGPFETDLLDPAFAERFAAYAERVARRFPWVRRWTPINEPLTTARFATLYGVWYPNRRDDRAFGRAMFHQTRAQQLAMERIRRIVPDAQFILTDDLQRFTAADPGVQGYVAFLRERVFLSVELVAGRVDDRHPLFAFLRDACGVTEPEFALMRAQATPPDLVAFDHYVHSERFVFTAPAGRTGDVPAVYVAGEPAPRCAPLLRAAWERLRLPLALGEVHIHAPADERVRWLAQHADDVASARGAGVDLRAIGAWAAFGLVDWHSLLRRREGIAEDGIFTFAGVDGVPQRTAVADAVAALVRGEPIAGAASGWWERDARLRAPLELFAQAEAGVAEGAHVIAGEALA